METTKRIILHVDPYDMATMILKRLLGECFGHTLLSYNSFSEAMDAVRLGLRFDFAIVEAGIEGEPVMDLIRQLHPHIPIVCTTIYTSDKTPASADALWLKPFDPRHPPEILEPLFAKREQT